MQLAIRRKHPFRSKRARLTLVAAGTSIVALLGAIPAAVAHAQVPAAAGSHLSGGLNFRLVWSKDLPGAQFRASSPTTATLDGGGPAMVVGSLNGKVYAYHLSDGSAASGWPVQLDKPIDSSPSVANVGRNSEVFVGTGTYDSGTGGGYWGLTSAGRTALHYSGSDPNQASEPVYASPALADITCGGGLDVVAGALGQDSYSLDAQSGTVLPGWPLFTYDTVFSSPSIAQVNGQTLPAFHDTLKGVQKTMGVASDALSGDSPLQQNLGTTLEQVQRMARSLRVLTDYLGGHPEALIRGRRADDKPATTTAPAAAAKPSQGSQP